MGFLAVWNLKEGSGLNSADTSGNSNNLTLSSLGTAWQTGHVAGTQAVFFDGLSGYAEAANSPSLNPSEQITISAWVYHTNNTGQQDIVNKNLEYGLSINSSGQLCMAIQTQFGPVWSWQCGGAAIPLTTWTFVQGTYSGTSIQLWVQGQVVATIPYPNGSIIANTNVVRVGNNKAGGGIEFFAGRVDETRIIGISQQLPATTNIWQSYGIPLVYGWTVTSTTWVHPTQYDVTINKQRDSSILNLTYDDNIYVAHDCGTNQYCIYRLLIDGAEVANPGQCWGTTDQNIACGGGGPWVGNDVSHKCNALRVPAGPHTISVQQYGWCCVGGCNQGNNGWNQQGITVEELP